MIPSVKFTGGFNSPGIGFGRRNTTWPFGQLEFGSGVVELRSTLGWGSAQRKVRFSPADVYETFYCRNYMFGQGVAFQLDDGTEFYFWTMTRATATKILGELEREGFNTSTAVRGPMIMRARRPPSDRN